MSQRGQLHDGIVRDGLGGCEDEGAVDVGRVGVDNGLNLGSDQRCMNYAGARPSAPTADTLSTQPMGGAWDS